MASDERTETFPAPAASAAPSAVSGNTPGAEPRASERSSTETDREEQRQPTRSPASTGSQPLSDQQSFQITCLRNCHYHEDRERFFARWHKLTMFVVVLGGAASFAPLEEKYWIAASVVTIAGLIDLVFDVSGKARLHASLRRRIYEILAEAQDEVTDLTKLRKRAIDVYADEPPSMHAVNALAYNGAMAAFERPPKLQFKIEWYQRLLRNVWPYPADTFKTYEELDKLIPQG